MSRTATLVIIELHCAFIIEYNDAFKIEIILVRKVLTLGFVPMQIPKMRTFFGGPFPCVALVREVRVVREVSIIDLALFNVFNLTTCHS